MHSHNLERRFARSTRAPSASRYDGEPGAVAIAAFEAALYEAGPEGLSPALLSLVHVPGLPPVSMAFRLRCIEDLRARGRCVVSYVPCRPPRNPDEMKRLYRHACHVPARPETGA